MKNRYKFLIAGGANTGITFVMYVALIKSGLNYNAALAVVYPIGIAMGFLVNRWWTFAAPDKTKTKAKHTQLLQYIAVYGLIFLVNLLTLNLLVQVSNLTPILAQVFALTVSTVCSYFLQKTWVFKS